MCYPPDLLGFLLGSTLNIWLSLKINKNGFQKIFYTKSTIKVFRRYFIQSNNQNIVHIVVVSNDMLKCENAIAWVMNSLKNECTANAALKKCTTKHNTIHTNLSSLNSATCYERYLLCIKNVFFLHICDPSIVKAEVGVPSSKQKQ